MNSIIPVAQAPADKHLGLHSSLSREIIFDSRNRPLHDLRISVTDQCNLRCKYCMPANAFYNGHSFLNKNEYLSFNEILRIVKVFAKLGISKVRITGGEPLLRENLSDLIFTISQIEGIEDLALTTNGILLKQYAKSLKDAGLKRITVSLDTLEKEAFHDLNGHADSLTKIIQGIQQAKKVGFSPIKINTVIRRNFNESSIFDLIEFCRDHELILRLIEYMDAGNQNNWKKVDVVPSREILETISKKYALRALDANYCGEVAKRYQFLDNEGEIGFISSVTQPFCGNCSRMRLSADGILYTCLFAEQGIGLKTFLRNGSTDDQILNVIRDIWQKREDRYSEIRASEEDRNLKRKKVEMYQIGG